MSAPLHDYDWWLERLEVARTNSTMPGRRDAHCACPIHGGSDSLHLTEKLGGRAVVNCFACSATYEAIEAAAQGGAERTEGEEDSGGGDTPVLRVTRRLSASKGPRSEGYEDGGGDTTPPDTLNTAVVTPLDWVAEYCNVPRSALDDMPIGEYGREVGFEFAGVARKFREAGSSKKFRWAKGASPPLWPVPTAPGPEVMIVEGEMDCVVMRHRGWDAYSLTKGADTPMGTPVFGALRSLGVQRVVLMLDADSSGQEATSRLVSEARESGLEVLLTRTRGVDPLMGEKDARDVQARGGDPEPEEVADDAFRQMKDLVAEMPEDVPWLGLDGVVYRGGTTIIAGPPKVGKTTLVYWVASNVVAAGMKVAIMTEENGPALKRKSDEYGLGEAWTLTSWEARFRGLSLDEAMQLAKAQDADLLIIDTFADWAGVDDENDATSVTRAMQSIRSAATAKTAVVLLHHTRKGGGESGSAIRGSTAFAGSADTLAELSDEGAGLRKMEVVGRVTDPTSYLFRREEDGSFSREVSSDPIVEAMDRLWQRQGGGTVRDILVEAGMIAPTSRGSATQREKVEAALQAGKIDMDPQKTSGGGPWYVPSESRTVVVNRVKKGPQT